LRIYKNNKLDSRKNSLVETLEEINSKIDRCYNSFRSLNGINNQESINVIRNELKSLETEKNNILIEFDTYSSQSFYFEYVYPAIRDIRSIIFDFNKYLKSRLKKLEVKTLNEKNKSKEIERIKTIIQNFGMLNDTINAFVSDFQSIHYYTIPIVNPPKRKLFYKDVKEDLLGNAIYIFHDWGMPEQNFPANLFFIKWLKKFGIGIDYEIIPHVNEAFEFNVIKEDGTKIPLADEGKGVAQIVFLLLKIGDAIQWQGSKKQTIIIEEPETGLHPAFQSKLTDLFTDVYIEYKIKFIIETHSEYILRRSQVIVARAELESESSINPFSVYYFPNKPAEKPYRMKYNLDGTFDKNFGSGFFDEASNNALELIRLKRLSQN
ncbi:MAG TPA: AAA family ATPase, partial [Bacteroidia bacterium]|nr:AAA family ATPase [Bacteroidia bacterium]